MNFRRIAATLVAMALPDIAHAHVGLHTDGALAGFSHPFSGLDHILAMVAVGFWALTLGGKARWIVPLAFVTVMAVGGGLGIYGLAFPMVETGIALTVALLGLLVAFEVKVSTSVAATVVGTCALFHGHAMAPNFRRWRMRAAMWRASWLPRSSSISPVSGWPC